MGRPRRNSNKSDSASTAGNVYNASLAAAQLAKPVEPEMALKSVPTPSLEASATSSSSTLTPQLAGISLASLESESSSKGTVTTPPISTIATPSTVHGRSLSISELVTLISSRASISKNSNSGNSQSFSSSSSSAINSLNLPESLKATLGKADSPILNALLPLIRQKLADKAALVRRNSTTDLSQNNTSSTTSLDSQNSRRSSASSRSEDHRLSHKLAERKRRKEMKDIFENLKNSLPPGVPKSSKWEILNEASITIDELLAEEQALLNRRNKLLKQINDSSASKQQQQQ